MENPSIAVESALGKENPPSSVAFIHRFMDEYGLDPYEFRIYTHMVRRTGGKLQGVCFSSISTISDICKISSRKTQQTIRVLINARFITQNKRLGRTDEYRVRPASEWVSREELVEIRRRLKDPQQKEIEPQSPDDVEVEN